MGMGGHFAAHFRCGFNNGFKLIIEKLLPCPGIGVGEYPACGCDLYDISSVFNGLADSSPAFGWAIAKGFRLHMGD